MLSISLRQFLRTIYPRIQFNRNVTDNLFVFIETHPIFLSQYNQLCQTYGTSIVNPMIGRLVKTMNDLSNTGRAVATSSFIQTYTLH